MIFPLYKKALLAAMFTAPAIAIAASTVVLAAPTVVLAAPTVVLAAPLGPVVSFEQAIQQSILTDPQLKATHQQVQAKIDLAEAARQMPDPKVSLSMANLPVDGLSLSQEGMTQIKVGISQQFPRGDSLEISARQQKIAALGLKYSQQLRLAEIRRDVGNLWLEAHYWRQMESLLKKNYGLFEHLVEVSNNQYASGSKRLADVVRAELELTRLDDRLVQVQQQQAEITGRLSGWLAANQGFQVAETLPALQLPELPADDFSALARLVSGHPALQVAQENIHQQQQNVLLAEQAFKPAFSVNGSYGLRQDGDNGVDRADLFSVGVTLDIPMFSGVRQDKQLNAAQAGVRAKQFNKEDLQRQMAGQLLGLTASQQRLSKRYELYQGRLLAQMKEQTQASLTSYTNNLGDFSEVMRASIAELNTEFENLRLTTNLLKNTNNIQYLLTKSTPVSSSQVYGHDGDLQ